MNTHSVELDGYYARSRGNSTIYLGTAGSHGNEQLQVTQGKGWEDLTVQVVFHPSKVAVQLPANGLLDVPWEATENPLTAMQGRIVFQGFDQDRLVNSTDLAYTVASHSPALGRDEEPYTPGIVEGVLNQMAADKDAILQAAQQTGQAKDAAAASANQAASSAASAQQSAGAANTSAGQAAASASQAAGSAAAAGEALTQVQTAGQEAQQKVKDAETEALDKIAAAAPALPAVSTDAAWQSVTVKPDGTGYNLAALAPIEATIRPTVTGNPAVCENSAAWGLQGLKIYGKSVQNGTPSPEYPVSIVSTGQNGGQIGFAILGKNLCYPINLWKTGFDVITGEPNESYPNAKYGNFIPAKQGDVFGFKFTGTNWANCRVRTIYNGAINGYVQFNNSESAFATEGTFVISSKCDHICVLSLNGNLTDCIIEAGNLTLSSNDSQSLTLSVPNGLPGIPVESGNYTDSNGKSYISNYWDFDDGQKHILCDEIAEYNGEAITTPYISSTGALTTGAQVLYALPEPTAQPIPTAELAAYRTLTTYSGTTVVSTAEPVAGLEVQYVADGTKYAEKVHSMESRLAALEAAQTGI